MRPLHRALVLAMLLLAAPRAQAAEILVTRHDDPPPDGCAPGDCSLREAVIDANSTVDLEVIHLSAGTYELTIPIPAGWTTMLPSPATSISPGPSPSSDPAPR